MFWRGLSVLLEASKKPLQPRDDLPAGRHHDAVEVNCRILLIKLSLLSFIISLALL